MNSTRRKILFLVCMYQCIYFSNCQRLQLNNPKDPKSASYLLQQSFDRLMTNNRASSGVVTATNEATASENVPSSLTVTASRTSRSVLGYTESVSLTASESSATIYYTSDGSSPSSNSTKYTQPLFPSKDFVGKTLKVVAVSASGVVGTITELNYFYPVLRTEQNVCYDNATNVVTCNSVTHAGQDGLVQAGKSQSYNGPISHTTYPSDIYTFDNNTGLTWQTCINGRSGLSCTGSDASATWASAQTNCSALDTNNAGAGYAGVTGWRLPTMKELFTLLRQESSANSISTANFPAPQPSYALTSTLYPPDTANSIYMIGFINQVATNNTKGTAQAYRCVSGPSLPASSFTDTGSGYLTDSTSGLSWTKCFPGETLPNCSGAATSQVWSTAISYCSNLSLGGKTWRLPNANELVGLIDPSAASAPYIKNASLFSPNLNGKTIYSSSTFVNGCCVNSVVGLTTTTGTIDNSISKVTSYYTLCVSGP
ncbi:DUF1566 domain-containing protein [Leptospira ognonensis]|uniref:DUF1566 domain-containing protein n=2 Tax=Leptospira ognonensis TaxID=2484945 RepID=A0A4R9JY45_9LEPT|nr:DUF1566 domain-containing protein [Leptospira ognonensis]